MQQYTMADMSYATIKLSGDYIDISVVRRAHQLAVRRATYPRRRVYRSISVDDRTYVADDDPRVVGRRRHGSRGQRSWDGHTPTTSVWAPGRARCKTTEIGL